MNNYTGLVFFPAFDWAISPTHPEREERLLYTRDQLLEEGVLDFPNIKEYKAKFADIQDILRVHFCLPSYKEIITDAHLIAAGSAIAIGNAWHEKEIKNGFALVRPPGHHAMHVTYGNRGFCNINNEAIMIEYLRKNYGYKKIAVIDTDVHHGDGTQDIFYQDPDVLYISFHQDGRTLYPGSGFIEELGGPNALGKTINIPLPPETGDEGLAYILDNLILPVLDDFQPEIIVNSAGQDNHFTDPLANMRITAQGYAELTEKLKPDILVLEGGYAVETALPYVNLAIILSLAGKDFSQVKEPQLKNKDLVEKQDNLEYVKSITEKLSSIWKNRSNIDLNEIFGRENYYQRKKQIFYDTEYFTEEQEETVKRCKDCGGLITIKTRLFSRRQSPTSLCISIPMYACPKCQKEGKDKFLEECKKGDFAQIFLQNKPEDTYLSKDDIGE